MGATDEEHGGRAWQAQPAVFPGFAVREFVCGRCGCEWVGVAAVGTVGLQCPKCDLYDPAFAWLGPKPWAPHDGAWLTGGWLLPWLNVDDVDDVDEIDRTTGEPRAFLKRWLQRLQAAWWALKGEF